MTNYAKYHNRKVTIDGEVFHSGAEARRWPELQALQAAGEIKFLGRQPKFELQPAFRDRQGKRHAAITYTGDFCYMEDGKHVVEDVKGAATQVFALKVKLFMYAYPNVELRIVKAVSERPSRRR